MAADWRVLTAAGVGIAALAAAGVGLAVLVGFGGSGVGRLALSPAPSGSPGASPGAWPAAGTWTIAGGSVAGYRVREQLASLPAPSEAVGRTSSVTGTMTIGQAAAGFSVTAASFTVDVRTLTSDQARRDQRIHQIGLESDRFPTATFRLNGALPLPADAATGRSIDLQASGELTIHGTARTVTIPISARLSSAQIEAAGSITFPFRDFGMVAPSIAGFVSVQDTATMEFHLFLERQ